MAIGTSVKLGSGRSGKIVEHRGIAILDLAAHYYFVLIDGETAPVWVMKEAVQEVDRSALRKKR